MRHITFALLLLAPIALGQSLPTIRTELNLSPVRANQRLEWVRIDWTQSDCSDTLKFKFFHRDGDTLVPYAERGPYAVIQKDLSALLWPPVDVLQGDLIGVVRLHDCGEASLSENNGFRPATHLAFGGDVTTAVRLQDAITTNGALRLSSSGQPTASIRYVVPVAGSLTGAFGSQFRTRMQLMNPGPYSSLTGTMIFHPAGRPGRQSDPSLPYSLAPGQVVTYDDVVAAMGQTGLGSIDFLVPANVAGIPVVTTRVFNDSGANGTTGFEESPFYTDGSEPLRGGVTGHLILPPNPAKERYSIGIRTLDYDTTLKAELLTPDGTVIATAMKSYPPNVLEQTPVASFFGQPARGNDVVRVWVQSGLAYIYGTATDNTTNDPAIRAMTITFSPPD